MQKKQKVEASKKAAEAAQLKSKLEAEAKVKAETARFNEAKAAKKAAKLAKEVEEAAKVKAESQAAADKAKREK